MPRRAISTTDLWVTSVVSEGRNAKSKRSQRSGVRLAARPGSPSLTGDRLFARTRLVRRGSVIAFAVVALVLASGVSAAPPPGATAQCRDGTYSYSTHHSGTCSHHGGVAVWLDGSTNTSSSSSLSSSSASSGGSCGVERWTVKTLQDGPRLLRVRKTTVHYLVTRPAPHPLPSTRLPFERHIYTVVAAVTLVRKEADSDFHLVLQEGGYRMIAEAPSPSCDSKATPYRRKQMTQARAALRLCTKAQVTGVAFFDFKHGQTGVAPNAIELHPILKFRCLSG